MKQSNTLTIEQSLESIAFRLDELTGNAMGNSYLKLDMEPVELDPITDELEKLNDKVDKLTDAVDNIANELQSVSSIAETLENFLGWYIQFNEKQKTK
jgi:tetrahydromethanopterin S-methyltransferase subunit B